MGKDESAFDRANPDAPDQSASWTTNGTAPPDPATADDGGAATTATAPTMSAGDGTTEDTPDDDGAAFLAELARAMQTTAGTEHIRVSEDAEQRQQAHLDRIRAREASEADELRLLADGDVKGIDSWADAEIGRVQRERERRILARRRDLETSIEDHRSLVLREIAGVEAAILAYRAEVEAFFSRLDTETDPVAIATRAGSRPVFPDLDSIGPDDAPAPTAAPGDAASATADPSGGDESPAVSGEGDQRAADSAGDVPMVGVMDRSSTDPEAPGEAQAEPVADATVDTPTAAPGAGQPGEPGEGAGQPVETTTQANAVTARSSGALLQAVPALRPVAAWLRGDDRTDDHGQSS
jgi:hypothetical protein